MKRFLILAIRKSPSLLPTSQSMTLILTFPVRRWQKHEVIGPTLKPIWIFLSRQLSGGRRPLRSIGTALPTRMWLMTRRSAYTARPHLKGVQAKILLSDSGNMNNSWKIGRDNLFHVFLFFIFFLGENYPHFKIFLQTVSGFFSFFLY